MPRTVPKPEIDGLLAGLLRRITEYQADDHLAILARWVADDLLRRDRPSGYIVKVLEELAQNDNYVGLAKVLRALSDHDSSWIRVYLTDDEAVRVIDILIDTLLESEREDLDELIIEALTKRPEEAVDKLRGRMVDSDEIWDIIKDMFHELTS